VVLLDEVLARAMSERQVTATLAAAGMKDKSGKQIKITDPDEERRNFNERLRRPFDFEQQQAAMLKVVGSA
jgi:hypothetical protein